MRDVIRKNKWIYLLILFMFTSIAMEFTSIPCVHASSDVNINDAEEGSAEKIEHIIFVGDYVATGMKSVSGNNESETWITGDDKGLTWLKSVEEKINPTKNTAVVIVAGFNEVSNISRADDYVAYINGVAKKWGENGVQVYYDLVAPVDEIKYGSKLNKKIESWNKVMKSGLSENVTCIDAYSVVKDRLTTKNDGYHYTDDMYKTLYDYNLHNIGVLTPEEKEELEAQNLKPKEIIATDGWGIDKDGYRVYYDANQNIVVGWRNIDGGSYYFNDDGHYVTGLQTIGDKTYYFNSIGLMRTGICKVNSSNHISIFGEDGARLSGWQEYKGERYYIGPDGWCLTGWWTIGTRVYYFQPNGAAAHGITMIENDIYYFDDDGAVIVGWQEIDGQKYYFLDGGKMAVGKTMIGDYTYYFDDNGICVTGWNAESDGMRCYDENGIMMIGFGLIGEKYYYFSSGGLMQTGWYDFNDGRRYFTDTGAMAIGENHIDEDIYYFDEEGYMQTGVVRYPDGTERFFDEDGKMKTGWQTRDGKRYYIAEDGALVTGIHKIGNKFCFFGGGGSLIFAASVLPVLFMFFLIFACISVFYFKKHPEKLASILDWIVQKLEGNKASGKNDDDSKKETKHEIYEDDDEVIED